MLRTQNGEGRGLIRWLALFIGAEAARFNLFDYATARGCS